MSEEKIIASLKSENDGLIVEYDVMAADESDDSQLDEINAQISSIDYEIDAIDQIVEKYDKEIDTYTNKADKIDYIVAFCCGGFTGVLDVFFVGDFDFVGARADVDKSFKEFVQKKAYDIESKEKNEKIDKAIKEAKKKAHEKGEPFTEEQRNSIIDKINRGFEKDHDLEAKFQKAVEDAKRRGETIDPDRLKAIREDVENKDFSKRIKHLEEAYGMPSDSVWNEPENGISIKSHHLDDLAHHPTVVGWAASMLTQFTGNAYFQNKDGINMKIKAMPVRTIRKGKEVVEIQLIGGDLKTKFICGTINWLGHLVSDMAGSNSSAYKGNPGMGLPGPMLSTLKEFAMLPFVKKTSLPEKLYELFTRDDAIFGEYRLDLRSELAIGKELGKQAIPVFINAVFVRMFYAIRHFIIEAKEAGGLKGIAWRNVLPFKNRTVIRMLTISLGTFEAVDLAEAAIKSAVKSRGNMTVFFKNLIVRANIVGIGRVTIAMASDVSMGVKREIRRKDRINVISEQIDYLEAKVYYKNASMWISADKTADTINEAYDLMEKVADMFVVSWEETKDDIDRIGEYIPEIEKKNPRLTEDMLDVLSWG